MNLSDYAGTYEDSAHTRTYTFAAKGDRLIATLSNQPSARVFPTGPDSFQYRVVSAKLIFTRNAEHVVNAVVLFQSGQQAVFVKPGMSAPSELPNPFPTPVALTPAQLDEYVANYASAGGTFFVTRQDQQLVVRLNGQPALPVFASAKDAFFYKAVDAQITFVRDSSGHVTGLVLHQNGAELPAQRNE
jgi:hypothetical protein